MKKILLISVLLCYAFTVKSQINVLSINIVLKIADCSNKYSAIEIAKDNGFSIEVDSIEKEDDILCYKDRFDIEKNKYDILSFENHPDWSIVKLITYDSNIEIEYKQLLEKGEIKETINGISYRGGNQKTFIFINYPNIKADLFTDKKTYGVIYRLEIYRPKKQ